MNIIRDIYNNISINHNIIYKNLYNILNNVNVSKKIEYKLNNNSKVNLTENKFLPKKVIHNFKNLSNTISISINNIKFNIFYLKNENINYIIKLINILVYVYNYLESLFNKHVSNLNVDIYLTDLKKKSISKEKHSLTAFEVNSGYSIPLQNYICIWRKEEIIKVFIHELLHIFNLGDINNYKNDNINKYYLNKYNINVQNNIYIPESIIDFFAILINTYIITKLHSNSYELFITNLHIEIYFILKQGSNVLYLSDVNHINKYTNVLSYYIIKGEMFKNIDKILEIFIKNKKINLNKHNYDKLCLFLKNNDYKINEGNNDYNTLRMSIIHL